METSKKNSIVLIYLKLKFGSSIFNPLIANRTKWSNTLKLFVGKFADELFECDHFVGLTLKGLILSHESHEHDKLILKN